jgi:plastocyanin
MMRALWVYWWVALVGQAWAGPVKGSVKLPDEPRTAEPISGYWRVENGVLPVQPAADARGEVVVVLEPATPAKADPPTVTVELHGLRLDPRVLAVPVGATVQFKNSDRTPHTLYIERGASMMAPEPTPAGQTRSQKFLAAGEYKLRDEEYPHVWGLVLAVSSPYTASADANGTFKLDAPDGKYTAKVWWRGGWVLSQSVTVGKGDLNLVVPSKK